MSTTNEIVKAAVYALEDKKAEDIRVIKIDEISPIADYLIIANGTNSSQIRALQDGVEEELTKINVKPQRIEGIRSVNWILMDYTDVIVHIFSREDREFYDLERMWRDGKDIDPKSL